jgi:hypothetical protein
MQDKKTKTNLDFEDDSNLRGIPSATVLQKPDSYYLSEVNKIVCEDSNMLIQDIENKNNYFCVNNGPVKKLVEWKKIDDLWIPHHLTNTSQYKEVDGKVCKIVSDSCDAFNPSQDCMLKCFLNDKTSTTYKANYMAFP